MSREYKKIINKIDSFNQILKIQSNLNCIVSDLSTQAQSELDSFNDKQKDGNLYGKTIAIKDNINIKGVRSSCASRMLKDYISPYNATVVEKIKKEGGIILGTTNMDEFAMGSSTEHSVYGPTINSYGNNLVPGGSSGGSAVSVSSKMVDLALGSDTGGSVRQPASFCGVYGLKPTYGRISRYGLTAFASSFDQIGIFSRNINDMAELFYTISGYDKYDSTSSNKDVEIFKYSENKVREMKIGMPYKLDSFDYVNSEVLDSYYKMIDFLKSEGFDLVELDMKNLKYSVPTYYVLTTAEASSNLARFDGVRYGLNAEGVDINSNYCNTKTKGFGDEVKRRVIIGTYVLSSGYYDAFYSKAQKVRTIIKSDFDKAFNSVDLLFLPTSPELPYRLGDKMEDPLSMYMADIFTVPMNLSGIPAISVPADLSRKGLPIGMQFAANNFEENNLFSICKFLSDNNKIIN